MQENALAFDELLHVLQTTQPVLILATCFSRGVPPFRLSSRLLLLLMLTLASATGTCIPRFVVIRVLMLRGAGVVPPPVLPRRMATATALEVEPLRPLPMAQAIGNMFARPEVRQCMALLEMNISFPNALPLHRSPRRSAIAALLEREIRLSMPIDMTLLACIRAPMPDVPGVEPLVASVGGRSITALADELVVPVMAHATLMGPAGIRCVARHMCPRSIRLAPTFSDGLVLIDAIDSMLFTGLMLPVSGLMTVAPPELSSVILPVVIGPVDPFVVGRILRCVRLADGTEFRAMAQGMQHAFAVAVPNAKDRLVVPTAVSAPVGGLMADSRVGRVDALRMHGPRPIAALAPGAARPIMVLTAVGSAPVGWTEKHMSLALAPRLLEMAIRMFICFEAVELAPNMSRLLVWAEMMIRLSPRGIVDINATGLLLGLRKSLSVPAAHAVFRLMLHLGGALVRPGVRPVDELASAIAIPVAEARLCLLSTLQANAIALVEVVEVLSRRHWLLHIGDMATLLFVGVLIPATRSME